MSPALLEFVLSRLLIQKDSLEVNSNAKAKNILHLEKKHKEIRQANEDALDVIETLTGDNQLKKMTLYQKLYLSSHEKCQRLEEKIIQRGSWIFRLREWLSFYKK